jgi:hypothetical protein
MFVMQIMWYNLLVYEYSYNENYGYTVGDPAGLLWELWTHKGQWYTAQQIDERFSKDLFDYKTSGRVNKRLKDGPFIALPERNNLVRKGAIQGCTSLLPEIVELIASYQPLMEITVHDGGAYKHPKCPDVYLNDMVNFWICLTKDSIPPHGVRLDLASSSPFDPIHELKIELFDDSDNGGIKKQEFCFSFSLLNQNSQFWIDIHETGIDMGINNRIVHHKPITIPFEEMTFQFDSGDILHDDPITYRVSEKDDFPIVLSKKRKHL